MKNKNVAGILALFLGSFGIHKFYLNQPVMGFIYLIFSWTLIPAFIAFFESLFLLFGDENSFNLKYNQNLQIKETISESEQGHLKECPFCAEKIKAKAVYCKHCQRDIPV